MSLRLPKSTVLTYLLAPSFPGISASLLDKFFHLFAYNNYGSAMDYSEYLVMMWTLWYGQSHDEFSRFLFTLFDVNNNGRIGKKEYRKVAQILLEEYSAQTNKEGGFGGGGSSGTNSASSTPRGSHHKDKDRSSSSSHRSSSHSSSSSTDSHDYLAPLYDFYFLLACYHYDRDHDKMLSFAEFANFAAEDLVLATLIQGRQEARQAKQRLRELLGPKSDEVLLNNTTLTHSTARPSTNSRSLPPPASVIPLSLPSQPAPTLSSISLHRNFLTADEEIEETTGTIWRQQRRSTIKQVTRLGGVGSTTVPANANGIGPR